MFQNELTGSNWLSLKLVGTNSNRDGIGARVVLTANGKNQYRQHSVFSSSRSGSRSHRLHFGLGGATSVDSLVIHWQLGCTQTLDNVPSNQILEVTETCPPESLEAIAVAFLRQGANNRNEGANPMMRVRKSGKNRALVKFDPQSIGDFGTVTKATLRLTIQSIGNNWGSGRTVDVHPLNVDFAEGNGKAAGLPQSQSTRGTGSGVTWRCAIDTDISNQMTDCNPVWNGGDFATPTATGVTHTSGQTGAVEWEVTADVMSGASAWLVKKTEEGQNGLVEYYSREGAADAGDGSLAPTLILE